MNRRFPGPMFRPGLLVSALLLAACSSTPVPEDSFYRLGNLPEPARVYPQPAIPGRVMIEVPRAAGIRRQRGILYSDDPDHVEVRRYYYHFWEEPPPQMLQRRMIERLRLAQAAESVTERLASDVNYRLRSRIREFDRRVDGDQATAVIDIDVIVFTGYTEGQAMFRESYREEVVARSREMVDTAAAFSSAMDRVIDRLIEDLDQFAES
ncbi:MAG: ABC-type transport auxiliary lipoprotein family protein [Pseudomonadota bacterium]